MSRSLSGAATIDIMSFLRAPPRSSCSGLARQISLCPARLGAFGELGRVVYAVAGLARQRLLPSRLPCNVGGQGREARRAHGCGPGGGRPRLRGEITAMRRRIGPFRAWKIAGRPLDRPRRAGGARRRDPDGGVAQLVRAAES
jgi:hypothetical protein